MARSLNVAAGRVPTAFQRFVQNNSTAVSLNSTVRTAAGSIIQFTVETNAVRVRADGTDPTGNTGVLYPTGVVHEISGWDSSSTLKFISGGAASTVNVQKYKYRGE